MIDLWFSDTFILYVLTEKYYTYVRQICLLMDKTVTQKEYKLVLCGIFECDRFYTKMKNMLVKNKLISCHINIS